MAKTYEPISTTTLATATGTVTFSSVPQTYTDLVLVTVFATATINEDLAVRFNSDTGSNYSRTHLRGNGSTASSSTATSQNLLLLDVDSSGSTLNTGLQTVTHFMNYANTSIQKSVLSRSGTLGGSYTGTSLIAGLWRDTTAISTIGLFCTSGNFVSGSTFTLYGIKAA